MSLSTSTRRSRKSLLPIMPTLLLAILAACGTAPATPSGSAPTAAPAAPAAATAAPAAEPAPTAANAADPTAAGNANQAQPVEITILSRVTTTDAPLPGDDWFWYKAVKDQLNIDVKVTFVTDPSQYLPTLQTRAAANDMPDLSEPDVKLMANLADQGLLAEWTPYLQYLPKYIKDREVTELAPVGTIEGKHFGLVNHVVFPFKPNITLRKDWLDKLGLKMPKTIDEYFEVMKAFTFKDPDGNGKNDTYGFSGAVDPNGALVQFDPIFGAFDALGDWRAEGGQLVQTATSARRLAALQFINQMEQAGVMDPDWKAQKPSDFRNKWRAGTIGVFSDEWCAVYCVNNYPLFAKANPTGVLVIGEPPVGTGGTSGSGARSKANIGQMPVISQQAADAGKGEAIARLLEWMNGDGYLLTVYGEEGTGYTKGADGKIEPITNNDLLTLRQMSRWAQNGTDDEWLTRYNQDVKQADGTSFNVYKDVLRRVYDLPFTEVTQFAPLPQIPAAKSADYTRTVNEGAFQFASGQRPFSEWDAYVTEVKANGLDAWVEVAQKRAQEIGVLK